MTTEELQVLSLYELVESHLDPLKMTEELQEQILQSFLFICRDRGFINNSSGETFYSIPYQEITECIYDHDFEISDELNSVIEGLIEPLRKVLNIDRLSNEDLKKDENISSVHELNAYKRFVSHIELAVCQKKFIARETLQVALNVKILQEENQKLKKRMEASFSALNKLVTIVEKFNENLKVSQRNLDTAQQELNRVQSEIRDSRNIIIDSVSSAQQAVDQSTTATEIVASVRQDITLLQTDTKNALNEAKKAQKDAEDSKTQFVTILGIFASIIVALFGGMSLIRATVELLQNSSNLLVLVFVTSILLLSFSLLIILLTSWISSLKSEQESKHYYVLRWMTLFILTIVAIVCGTLVHDNPTDKSETRKPNFELEIKTKGSS